MNIHYEKGNLFSVCAWSSVLIRRGSFFDIFTFCRGTMDQFRGTIWINFSPIISLWFWISPPQTPIFQTFRVFHVIRKYHKQEFDSPRLHHQKPPISGGLIVSRETFWINRGTMVKNDRFRYFSPNQNLIKIDYKFTINTKTTFCDIMSDFVRNCPKLSDNLFFMQYIYTKKEPPAC